eukprot:gene8627-17796_t
MKTNRPLEISLDTDIFSSNSYESIPRLTRPKSFYKRWSVLEKVNHRYCCCGYRSYNDCCFHLLTCRCILSIFMLGLFVVLAIATFRTFPTSSDELEVKAYDFIIVGAGPAGCVLSRILSDRGYDVLLLEAGGVIAEDDISNGVSSMDIPLMWPSNLKSNDRNMWKGLNSPDVYAMKAIGGNELLGPMIHLRAIEDDILNWNITNWKWNKIQEIYNSNENFMSATSLASTNLNINSLKKKIKIHKNYEHPITTTTTTTTTNNKIHKSNILSKLFIATSISQGIEFNDNFNNPERRDGKSNLEIITHAKVNRILLQSSPFSSPLPSSSLSKQSTPIGSNEPRRRTSSSTSTSSMELKSPADAIAYLKGARGGRRRTSTSSSIDTSGSGSVILTAGSILTPHLLMLSGIGSREILEPAGIEVEAEVQGVGKNLQDHFMVEVIFQVSPELASNYDIDIENDIDNDIDYGVFGSPAISAGAFLISPYARTGHNGDNNNNNDNNKRKTKIPDIQLTIHPSIETARSWTNPCDANENPSSSPSFSFSSVNSNMSSINNNSNNINSNIFDDIDVSCERMIMITATLLYPEGSREIILNVTHPKSPPVIQSQSRTSSSPLPQYATTTATTTTTTTTHHPNTNNLLSDLDVKRLHWAIERIRSIMSSQPIAIHHHVQTSYNWVGSAHANMINHAIASMHSPKL